MKRKSGYRLSAVGLVLLMGVFYGCAGREYAPKKQVWYYHKELPAADRAVEAARAAGKDKECPAEFAAAEKMKNDGRKTIHRFSFHPRFSPLDIIIISTTSPAAGTASRDSIADHSLSDGGSVPASGVVTSTTL